MPSNFAAAKATIAMIAGSSAGLVGAPTIATMALTDQLKRPHEFLYLHLPIWYFFLAAFVLSAIGAVSALFTDAMSDPKLIKSSIGRKAGKVIVGFVTGIIGSFIVLPSFTAHPPMGVFLLTSLIVSFSGSVLIHNLGELKRDEELQASVRRLIVSKLKDLIHLLTGGKS